MEDVEAYNAYHISDIMYQEDMALNTTCFKRSFDDYDTYKRIVELNAERVRVDIDPNLPSRKECLFVCKKEYVRYWFNYIEKRRRKRCFIYKLELNGKLLWTYADYLQANQYKKYWCPKMDLDFVEHEGLFIGDYKIISTCNIAEFSERL